VGLSLAGGNGGPPEPPEAGRIGAARRARHYAALVFRRHGNLRRASRVGKQDDIGVLPEKRYIRRELSCRCRRRGLAGRPAARNPRTHCYEQRQTGPQPRAHTVGILLDRFEREIRSSGEIRRSGDQEFASWYKDIRLADLMNSS
jgi:hypothetical protein